MKKIILGLLVSMLWLVSPNNVMAADYWVYSESSAGSTFNYYVVTESLEAVKGAYHIDVKEVGPSGKPYKYTLGVYGGGIGTVVYYRADVKPIRSAKSNGHDLPYAVWKYVTTHDKGLY
jgi:hypothetical protein